MMFGSAESEYPRLTNGEIISDVFQVPTYVITIYQRYRQTDGQTDMRSQYRFALKCIAR